MNEQKYKVGLALGSGSARGWSHIGVIQELAAMGIEIHAVAGCSIGSLVGGIYAQGRLNELESWARSLTLKQMALLMDPTFMAGGILRGEKVFKVLRRFKFDVNIETLPLKFAAVATDMDTGEEVWLKNGSLLDAVRASCALPGLLCPHRRHDRWLIDGGLVNPVPVDLVRSLGCDKIIAVNLNHDLVRPCPVRFKNPLLGGILQKLPYYFQELMRWRPHALLRKLEKKQIEDLTKESQKASAKEAHSVLSPLSPGYRQVVWSMMNIMQDRITYHRLLTDKPDIELRPHLGHLALMQFHLAESSIEEGRESVRRQAKAIEKLLE